MCFAGASRDTAPLRPRYVLADHRAGGDGHQRADRHGRQSTAQKIQQITAPGAPQQPPRAATAHPFHTDSFRPILRPSIPGSFQDFDPRRFSPSCRRMRVVPGPSKNRQPARGRCWHLCERNLGFQPARRPQSSMLPLRDMDRAWSGAGHDGPGGQRTARRRRRRPLPGPRLDRPEMEESQPAVNPRLDQPVCLQRDFLRCDTDSAEEPTTVATSDPSALPLDEMEYGFGDGPCLSAIRELGTVQVPPSGRRATVAPLLRRRLVGGYWFRPRRSAPAGSRSRGSR